MPLPMEKSEIISIIDEHLAEKISAVEINQVREFDLRDRMVRVEEALKYQGEQFRMLISQMDKRFEQVDKRFEQVDKRFEQVDKRFEQMDKRFESMQASMDKRFNEQHNDIAELGKRMDRFMLWSFGATFSAAGIIIAVMKFLF